MAATTFSAKEVAQEAGTDGRTMRKFLREFLPADEQPGQGGRYSFTKGEVAKIVKAFKADGPKTRSTTEAANKDKGGKKNKKSKAAPVETEAPAKGKGKKAKASIEAEELSESDVLTEDELKDLADLDGPTPDELDAEAEETLVLDEKPAKKSRSKK